jgi:hypothetical protein
MNTNNRENATATGALETPEPAIRGRCNPHVSLSHARTTNSEVPSQVSEANHGAGNMTGGGSEKQALLGGRQAIDATARPKTNGPGRLTKCKLAVLACDITEATSKNP